ncbi:MAG: hypothetical protein H7125_13095, partial [Proteobacteria bacterium]|nr:hypothetical protein [Burkholderiales bacterium]
MTSASDALRALDCWLWRVDADSARIHTLGGESPFGVGAFTWRAALRLCAPASRADIV